MTARARVVHSKGVGGERAAEPSARRNHTKANHGEALRVTTEARRQLNFQHGKVT
jgi:hypothetical protein